MKGKLQIIIMALSILSLYPIYGDTLIVDKSGEGDYTSIQDAINHSCDGDIIELMPDTYYENINFYGLAIKVTSINPYNPYVVKKTVIVGDPEGKTVVFESLEGRETTITGVTVRGGEYGIHCSYGSPTISYCLITNNGEGIRGSMHWPGPHIYHCLIQGNRYGGHYVYWGLFENCTITQNEALGLSGENAIVRDCVITNNALGGLSNNDQIVENCYISANGGFGIRGGSGDIVNCVISGNAGDGIAYYRGDVENCTIVGNRGNGLYVTYDTRLKNNIIVNNGNYGILVDGVNITPEYNNIWGNSLGSYHNVQPSATDIHVNPLFAKDGFWDPNGTQDEMDDYWVDGDYHPKSEQGRWEPNSLSWEIDNVTSECIDAGDPLDDVGTEPNPNGNRINIGAYGGTAEASKSISGIIEPVCITPPDMDFTGDCKVNLPDFVTFASEWLECGLDPPEACWE